MSVASFFDGLKTDYKVDHFEDLIGLPNYPDYMCGRLDTIKGMFSDIRTYLSEFSDLEKPEDPGDDAGDEDIEMYENDLYDYESSVSRLHDDIVSNYRYAKTMIDEVYDMHVELDEWVSELSGSGQRGVLVDLRRVAESRGIEDFVRQIDSVISSFDNYFFENFTEIRKGMSRNFNELFEELRVVEELCDSRSIESDMAYYLNYIDDGRVVEAFRSDVEDFRSLGSMMREDIQILMHDAYVEYGIGFDAYE